MTFSELQQNFVILLFFIDLQCWIPGNCQGILIDEGTTADGNSCLDLCKANDDCVWFTFNPADESCVFLEDCQEVNEDCTDCLSGQRQCSAQKEGKLASYFSI